jgi:hypothetical protein
MIRQYQHDPVSLFNCESKTFILTICKNASSSIKKAGLKNNFKEKFFQRVPKETEKILVLIREPVERFISGVCEMLKLRHDDENRKIIEKSQMMKKFLDNSIEECIDEAINLVKKHPRINIHILPQHEKIQLFHISPNSIFENPKFTVFCIQENKIHPSFPLKDLGTENRKKIHLIPNKRQREEICSIYKIDCMLFRRVSQTSV